MPGREIADPPAAQGLTVVPAVDDPRATITVGSRAFGAGDEPEASDEDVSEWLVRAETRGPSLLGLLDGEPVAIASATPPLDGLSEVAGVGVLAHARRRGIGAAMTAAAARAAAAKGAELPLPLARLGRRAGRLHAGGVPARRDDALLRRSGVRSISRAPVRS